MRVLLDFPQTYQRVLFAATAFLLLGCGGNGSQQPLPRVKAGGVQVTLPWKDEARIAREYTCDGANRTPAVRVQPSPPGRVAIVMSDPDASGGTFIHWTRWGSSEGRNSFGRTGYDG